MTADEFIGSVGTCCVKESDCLSGKCEYGKCNSNCDPKDYHKANRLQGECCDYDANCSDGLTCFPGTKTCGWGGQLDDQVVPVEEGDEINVADD